MTIHSMQQSLVEFGYRIGKNDLNGYGCLHGGRLLTLCDEVAYLSASRHAGCACLTRAVHRARFLHVAMLDEYITIKAITGLTGFSSIWASVDVHNADNVHIMDAIFVFAAIDDKRKLIKTPAIIAESDEEKQLQANLKRMRNMLVSGEL